MKVITERKTEEITTSEITTKHFVVAKVDGNTCLAQPEGYNSDRWKFTILEDNNTGNAYTFSCSETVQSLADKMLGIGGEVHAFEKLVDALFWLAEKCEE
jgi:hypothetical protein